MWKNQSSKGKQKEKSLGNYPWKEKKKKRKGLAVLVSPSQVSSPNNVDVGERESED